MSRTSPVNLEVCLPEIPEESRTKELTPALKAETEDILRKSRYIVSKEFTYFSPGLYSMSLTASLKPCSSEGDPTFWVDQHMRCEAHPDFVKQLVQAAKDVSNINPCPTCGKTSHHKFAYISGLLVHEMMHPMQKHSLRVLKYRNHPDFNRNCWAAAVDCELNDSLLEGILSLDGDRVCLPPGGCYPAVFEMEDHKLAEEYYELLKKKADENKKESEKIPGSGRCGPGAEGGESFGGDEDTEDFDGVGEAELASIARGCAEEMRRVAKMQGNVGAGLLRWADGLLTPPKVDWRTKLAKLVRYKARRVKPGCKTSSYAKLSMVSTVSNFKVILPTYITHLPEVSVVQDTSGSMSQLALKDAISETEAICKVIKANICIIDVDAEARATYAKSVKTVKFAGGGGTDMRVGINKALEQKVKPNLIVIMTDGFTPWPETKAKNVEYLVCLVGESVADVNSVPSWMNAIVVEPGDKNVGLAKESY